jgi:feruloyl esterase
MQHCYGGSAPNSFGQLGAGSGDAERDMFDAIERWVEQGIAPERIIATKRKNDLDPRSEPLRTRPLCAYPSVARYKGTGSTDDAANYACVAP